MKVFKVLVRSSMDEWTEIGQDFDKKGALNLVSGFCHKKKLLFSSKLKTSLVDEGFWEVEGTSSPHHKFFIAMEEIDYDEDEID